MYLAKNVTIPNDITKKVFKKQQNLPLSILKFYLFISLIKLKIFVQEKLDLLH